MVPVPRQGLELEFAVRSAELPDAPDQPPFVAQPSQSRLVAAVGQLEASRTLANPRTNARRAQTHQGVSRYTTVSARSSRRSSVAW